MIVHPRLYSQALAYNNSLCIEISSSLLAGNRSGLFKKLRQTLSSRRREKYHVIN